MPELPVSTPAAPIPGAAGQAKQFAGREVTVVSWGSAYTRSQIEAYHKPFAAQTGAKVASIDYNGGIAQIKTQVDSNTQFWDVVDMEVADAVRACDEGLLEKIDPAMLPPAYDGTPAMQDFIPNAIQPCSVTTIIFSHVVAFDTTKFPADKQPSTLADFFDTAKFPGKRGLRKTSPKINLEMALRAAGVAGPDVYATLATPEGQAKAFAQLDKIRKDVLWWETGAQPPQLLADGEVAMTTGYNGRFFDAQIVEKKPFKIIWDGQIQEHDVLGIVKGAKNKDVALEFIRFATGTVPLAEQARFIAYGPARRSSLPLVSIHATAGVDMKPHMPNAPENETNAMQVDAAWWAEYQEELNLRWAAWLARG
ncbi:MAG TPA: spermidine/putrescine ABC transporter substrate-binding protein [Alphaproteobacteria bacterium]|nr:spermidine/putrescine ABC transporter substrate-binding protein [Alphaproteobacteria bacterium]HAJ46026.1 spermidine/putrescine ABC transporter substrate-binding protein [Alphaproteobacteria bacterium]